MTITLCLVAIILPILPHWLHLKSRILCGWNLGADIYLGLTLWRISAATPEKMRRYAQRENEGRVAISILIVAAACVSLVAIGFLLGDTKKGQSTFLIAIHVTLAVMTIVDSWLLVHTIFALRYAHNYYQRSRSDQEQLAQGLDFPDDHEPDYWDFLYFSFVIGMTSQVSDVQITSPNMRRLALIHGILSFFFNTAILAMSINIIAGLI
ncbi:MAG: DUF1345 domain-containing protein [Rhizonema sp. PD37]|nr:DUF1345 domain-containing protein [Rhizonema sp. PD37]